MRKETKRIAFKVLRDLLLYLLISILAVIANPESPYLPIFTGLLAYICCLSTLLDVTIMIVEDVTGEKRR